MDEKAPLDEREELYLRFKKDIEESPRDIFYDEDEFVAIFDYATDYNDDFIRLEALLHGFKLYPDSEELYARRGYYYYSMSLDDGVRSLAKSADNRSTHWRILQLRLNDLSPEAATEALLSILEDSGKMSDEEIIQFVDCASSIGQYKWLVANLNQLRLHCGYLPTLLYEIQIVANANNDNRTAIEMAEQLTELEPFNVEFWSLLAELHIAALDMDEALTAAEYALAIDPTDEKSIIAKAKAMLALNMDVRSIVEPLSSLVDKFGVDDEAFVQLLAVCYVQLGMQDRATELLLRFIELQPEHRGALDYLMLLRYPKISELLTVAMRHSDIEENVWLDWADELARNERVENAYMLYAVYNREVGLSISGMERYFGFMYSMCRYSDIVSEFDAACANKKGMQWSGPVVGMTVVLSLLRLKLHLRALEVAKHLKSDYCLPKRGIEDAVTRNVYVKFINTLVNNIEQNVPFSVNEIDPFSENPDLKSV